MPPVTRLGEANHLKRSNRLILLIGIFLAVVAFVGIILVSQQPSTGPSNEVADVPAVFAKTDIPLGTELTQAVAASSLEIKNIPPTSRDATAFADTSLLIGRTVRADVKQGKQLTSSDFGSGAGQIGNLTVPAGLRGIAVQVDQVSGVGTVIQPGDWVDLVLGLTGDKFPVVTVNPTDSSIQAVAGLNGTSIKVLIQGAQVLGTLLPPPTTTAEQQQQPQPSGTTGQTTALNGQQEIVVLAVTAQQSELIKYAQLDGSITLTLRSPKDFHDPTTGNPVIPAPDTTTGITLKVLVDDYKVLPPELVETVLPAGARR